MSAAVADATEVDGVTTELLLDAVTDAWMQNFPAVTEDCFTNHLAATHAKVVASYKPLAHARQGLVIWGGISATSTGVRPSALLGVADAHTNQIFGNGVFHS